MSAVARHRCARYSASVAVSANVSREFEDVMQACQQKEGSPVLRGKHARMTFPDH